MENLLGTKSVPNAILDYMKVGKEKRFGSIVDEVSKYYTHRDEYLGKQFIRQRVDVALFRLGQQGKIKRVRHGFYKRIN